MPSLAEPLRRHAYAMSRSERPNEQNQSVIKGGLYEGRQAEQETGGPGRQHWEAEHEWIAS
jgi:hypothetical protein